MSVTGTLPGTSTGEGFRPPRRRHAPRRSAARTIASDEGLGLAEILIAMVIVAIGLIGLFGVLSISSASMQQGNQMSTATFLAQQRLEQLRAARWTAATPGAAVVDCLGISGTTAGAWGFSGGNAPGVAPAPALTPPAAGACTPDGFADESPAGAPLPDPHGRYTRQVRTQPCDAIGADCGGIFDPALRRVTVRVSYPGLYPGAASGTQLVELTTLLAQR